METAPASFKVFACRTQEHVREYDYAASGCSSATSAVPCAATTRHMTAQALPRLRLATRPLVVRIAPALLRLCRAFRRVVSPLDFSSVGCTGSRRASGHCVSRATTCRPDCTCSTTPMSCIRTHRLDARLLASRSHWLSPCARSFHCAL
jgi:hypothetical protein